jgi:hypothetical protein
MRGSLMPANRPQNQRAGQKAGGVEIKQGENEKKRQKLTMECILEGEKNKAPFSPHRNNASPKQPQ